MITPPWRKPSTVRAFRFKRTTLKSSRLVARRQALWTDGPIPCLLQVLPPHVHLFGLEESERVSFRVLEPCGLADAGSRGDVIHRLERREVVVLEDRATALELANVVLDVVRPESHLRVIRLIRSRAPV